MLRRWLRRRAFARSVDVLTKAKAAERANDLVRGRYLRMRSLIWMQRHLLLAGLSSVAEYRAAVRKARVDRRSGPPAAGAEREERGDGPLGNDSVLSFSSFGGRR